MFCKLLLLKGDLVSGKGEGEAISPAAMGSKVEIIVARVARRLSIP